MHDSQNSTSSREASLRRYFERLRELRSAWGVLAPSGLSGEKTRIAEAGRALSEDLTDLLSEPDSGDAAAIVELDGRLKELEGAMRDVALQVPVAQLRSTLPECVAADRRGVLDLLDLLLGAEIAGQGDTGERIPALDYVITLLCTGGDRRAPLQDPVTLTPRLHAICQLSEVDYDSRLPDLEAEFFAAADMHQADFREEVELRTLRRRKVELGQIYFAPRVLRAIITYNAALLHSIDEAVLESQDWGALPTADVPVASTSVFDADVLSKLAEALRRRTAGDPPAHDALDRIAWCLDLSHLTVPEREAVLSLGTGEKGLLGKTVLVGMLLRSAAVLDEEYPEIGISPEELAGSWVVELDEELRREVNERVATGGYETACDFADLSRKFLTGAKSDTRRRSRAERPGPSPAPLRHPHGGIEVARREEPKRIAPLPPESSKEKALRGLRQVPWLRVAQMGTAGLIAVAGAVLAYHLLWGEGRVAGAELTQISPFLASGKRSDEGSGSAFAGTLRDEWFALGSAEQTAAADELVAALRARGVREIMVYDDQHRLRVQALGSQPARVIER